MSASFLALIPKNGSPQELSEYRPISLIGCLYKMIAKVLAGRLKRVLGKVIFDSQNAFLPGKQILDGVVVVNEILDMAKRRKQGCLVLKADFKKAYDSVSWRYLEYMLVRLGFSDPLAHFLFIIAAEGLAGLVRQGIDSNFLAGFKINDSLSISLLQFADDTIFQCDGNKTSVWCLKAILMITKVVSFEMISGLKVNFAKSSVVGCGIDDNELRGISHFLACKIGNLPFKFLGIPVGANPRGVSTWQPIIDSIKIRLNSWKSRQLSIGGRVTLINSVLSSLPLYLFPFYKAPKKVIGEIVKLQRRFLWGGMRKVIKLHGLVGTLFIHLKDLEALG